MTEPVYPVHDIVVSAGQRRQDGSADDFRSRITFEMPPEGQHAEKEFIRENDECASAETRYEWDMDAAAAEATARMLAEATAAGEQGLNYRERAVYLLKKPDGRIVASDTYLGSIYAPNVDPVTFMDLALIADMSEIVGVVHTHPDGGHLPSLPNGSYQGDAFGLATLVNIMNHYTPYSGHKARYYIAAQTVGPNSRVKINIYTPSNIAAATGDERAVGPEVNPNGQACPIN